MKWILLDFWGQQGPVRLHLHCSIICLSPVLPHWRQCQGDGVTLFSLQCNCKAINDASQALSNIVRDRLYFYTVKAKELPILGVSTENTAFVTATEKKKALYLLSAHHMQM